MVTEDTVVNIDIEIEGKTRMNGSIEDTIDTMVDVQ